MELMPHDVTLSHSARSSLGELHAGSRGAFSYACLSLWWASGAGEGGGRPFCCGPRGVAGAWEPASAGEATAAASIEGYARVAGLQRGRVASCSGCMLAGRWACWLAGRQAGRQTGRQAGWQAGGLAGRRAGQWTGQLAGLLATF